MPISVSKLNKLITGRKWYHQRFDGSPMFLAVVAAETRKEKRKPSRTEADVRVCFFSRGRADWYLDMEDISRGADDFHTFKKGDILVASQTTPNFIAIMLKARAIVTNQGGVTSHAAIISRELKIPCVTGTELATQVLKDGDTVEVDAEKGVVRKLG